MWCIVIHDQRDDGYNVVGQPLCGRCYDYTGHVLFDLVGAGVVGALYELRCARGCAGDYAAAVSTPTGWRCRL